MIDVTVTLGPDEGVKLDPMKVLVSIIRYIHYATGITTPRPEQERMTVVIWVVSMLLIIALAVGTFLLLGSQLQSTR